MAHYTGDKQYKKKMIPHANIDNQGYREKWKLIGVAGVVTGIIIFLFSQVSFGVSDALAGATGLAVCLSPLLFFTGIILFGYGFYCLVLKHNRCKMFESRTTGTITSDDLRNMDRYFTNRSYKRQDLLGAFYFYRTHGEDNSERISQNTSVKHVIKIDPSYSPGSVMLSSYTYARGTTTDPTDIKHLTEIPVFRDFYDTLETFSKHFKYPFKPTSFLPEAKKKEKKDPRIEKLQFDLALKEQQERLEMEEQAKKDKKRRKSLKEQAGKRPLPPPPEDMHEDHVPCMKCGMPIVFTMKKCPYCGKKLF